MTMQSRPWQLLAWGLVVCSGTAHLSAASPGKQNADKYSRQVTFALTYANHDVLWLGDPASPAALLYPKPGARPIANDVQVSTLVESSQSPCRQYVQEARIAAGEPDRVVYAFTKSREQVVGAIDRNGRFVPNHFYKDNRELLPSWPVDSSVLVYDAKENALYYEVEIHGPRISEVLDFLPLQLVDTKGNAVAGHYAIDVAAAGGDDAGQQPEVSLALRWRGNSINLARATIPSVVRREQVQLGSFDNQSGSYLPESAYRAEASGTPPAAQASVTFAVAGEFTDAIQSTAQSLVLLGIEQPGNPPPWSPAKISIDGNFDDWRNVVGIDDPRGDLVPYLEYVPDVDLLEFKVAHDDQHIYLYARVAGQVGRSIAARGCSYFYAYMDVDQNPQTGFLPTRDDDCYFGVDLGDDCEVQFEFVDSTFRKTFYGFCGLGGNDNALNQTLQLGRSQYGRLDENGRERADYKAEYIYRQGATEITEDFKLGTSDTIRLAVSPNGREVEVVSELKGFLKDGAGRPIIQPGQTIDIAVGMECDGKRHLDKQRWAADSSRVIRGYQLRPTGSQPD